MYKSRSVVTIPTDKWKIARLYRPNTAVDKHTPKPVVTPLEVSASDSGEYDCRRSEEEEDSSMKNATVLLTAIRQLDAAIDICIDEITKLKKQNVLDNKHKGSKGNNTADDEMKIRVFTDSNTEECVKSEDEIMEQTDILKSVKEKRHTPYKTETDKSKKRRSLISRRIKKISSEFNRKPKVNIFQKMCNSLRSFTMCFQHRAVTE